MLSSAAAEAQAGAAANRTNRRVAAHSHLLKTKDTLHTDTSSHTYSSEQTEHDLSRS